MDVPLPQTVLLAHGTSATRVARNGAGGVLVAVGYAAHILAPPSPVGWTASPKVGWAGLRRAPLADVPVISRIRGGASDPVLRQSGGSVASLRQVRSENCVNLAEIPSVHFFVRARRCTTTGDGMVQTVQKTSGCAAGAVPACWWTSLRSCSDVPVSRLRREVLQLQFVDKVWKL